ncbi:MAG: DNA repair protein RadC [Bacteroidales bacterium]|nr:DNA repair protein RadC [Bacteroidales bacterium]
METGNSIRYWAEDDRPREKLLMKGKNALSDAELIAILIGSGSRELSAVELSRTILKQVNGNLAELSRLNTGDLQKFKGIGEAKAISIIAALELGRRRLAELPSRKKPISSSRDAFEYLQQYMADEAYEVFWVLLVNRANIPISAHKISEGGTAGTVADPKKIFRLALEHHASGIILSHNHPSGNIKPSETDIRLTTKIAGGAERLDINLLDHLIISGNQYFSFSDESMLNQKS